jgi:hypothetical protein
MVLFVHPLSFLLLKNMNQNFVVSWFVRSIVSILLEEDEKVPKGWKSTENHKALFVQGHREKCSQLRGYSTRRKIIILLRCAWRICIIWIHCLIKISRNNKINTSCFKTTSSIIITCDRMDDIP